MAAFAKMFKSNMPQQQNPSTFSMTKQKNIYKRIVVYKKNKFE
jgi:hypothetical protein